MSEEPNDEPLEELQRENDTTQGLLERLLELSELIKSGKEVFPGEVSEGLRLLEQYLTLHSARFDHELEPAARPVAMETCHPHLDHLIEEHASLLHQIGEFRSSLADSAGWSDGDRARIAEGLDTIANRTYAMLTFERDYPLSCLITALPEDTSQRVAAQFTSSQAALADLEQHIHRYLAVAAGQSRTPITVHCASPGCPETATGEVVPGRGGRLALLAPDGGWSMHSRKPGSDHEGLIHLQVDYYCPRHRTEAGTEDATSMDVPASLLDAWADDGGRVS